MKRFASVMVIAFLLMSTAPVKAQDYNVGLGLRLGGYMSGFSVKGFISPNGALEGIVGFGSRSFVTTGLYEHHFPIAKVEGLKLYVGGGAHVGFFGHDSSYRIYKRKNEKVYVIEEGRTAVIPGADFIFGAEYKFKGAPFTVGSDLKPFVDFYDGGASGYIDGAINVRYVF